MPGIPSRVILHAFFVWLATTAAASAQTVNVMTYNIRFDTPEDGINQWGRRKEKVFALIHRHDPDILGVQEALHHQLNDILKANPSYSFLGVGRDDGKIAGEFSAILYKTALYEVVQQNTFWLSETPAQPGSKSWDAAITRVATWARFREKRSGKEFLVINTHFDHIGKQARAKSAGLLRQRAEELGKNIPVIITGDFNCTREEEPYKVIITPTTDWTLDDTAPENPPGTFCGFEMNSKPCRAIDYIFISSHWNAKNYSVIDDHDEKYYPSDHLPVKVSVTLK
jgi:endonuclease/exonuclease/phosphatase family metal-dependent hydrolase